MIALWQREHELLKALRLDRESSFEAMLEAFRAQIDAYRRLQALLVSERGHGTQPSEFSFRFSPRYWGHGEVSFEASLYGVGTFELYIRLGSDWGPEVRDRWHFVPCEEMAVRPMQTLDDMSEWVVVGPAVDRGLLLSYLQRMVDPATIAEVQAEGAALWLERARERVEVGVSDWIAMAEEQRRSPRVGGVQAMHRQLPPVEDPTPSRTSHHENGFAGMKGPAQAVAEWKREHELLESVVSSSSMDRPRRLRAFESAIDCYRRLEIALSAQRGYPTHAQDVVCGGDETRWSHRHG